MSLEDADHHSFFLSLEDLNTLENIASRDLDSVRLDRCFEVASNWGASELMFEAGFYCGESDPSLGQCGVCCWTRTIWLEQAPEGCVCACVCLCVLACKHVLGGGRGAGAEAQTKSFCT